MEYKFLADTYETERIKTLSTWSTFKDEDILMRPNPKDRRGRNTHEHMVPQCMSENIWFSKMLGINVGAFPLPEKETRLEFMKRYAREIYSTYGPSADTGGLMQNNASTIYPYPDVDTLLKQEAASGDKAPLLGPGDKPCTERPDPG